MAKKTGGRVRESGVAYRVRKNMDMDPVKLEGARKILGARSETEAVDRALELVIGKHRSLTALRRLADRGTLKDIYRREA